MKDSIKFNLEKEGFSARVAENGDDGLKLIDTEYFDLIVLDLMLPGVNGLDICRKVRVEKAVPIVILTARDSDVDKIIGLEMGADDYMTKPFNMRELIARIGAVLRRAEKSTQQDGAGVIRAGEICIDEERHEVIVRGEVVDLPLIEYKLLLTFLKNPGKALPRKLLLHSAWEGDFYGQEKTLDVHIRRVREKVEKDPSHPEHIKTIRGCRLPI